MENEVSENIKEPTYRSASLLFNILICVQKLKESFCTSGLVHEYLKLTLHREISEEKRGGEG